MIRKLLMGALCSTVITGCALTNSDPYTINTNTKNTQPRKFVLKKVSGQGVEAVKPLDIKSAVSRFIENNSAFNKCSSSFSHSSCSKHPPGGIKSEWGANVSGQEKAFKLTYFLNDTYSTGDVDRATIELLFPYTIKETADSIQLTLQPANVAQAIPTTNVVGLAVRVPIPDEHVADWAHHTLTIKKPLEIDQRAYIKGSFDVDFDLQSVKANLIRLYGAKVKDKGNGVQSSTTFERRVGNSDVTTSLTLNVYRGKTKIEYRIYSPFKLLGDGTVSGYNPDALQIMLDHLKKNAKA